jgi:hypothetical protein
MPPIPANRPATWSDAISARLHEGSFRARWHAAGRLLRSRRLREQGLRVPRPGPQPTRPHRAVRLCRGLERRWPRAWPSTSHGLPWETCRGAGRNARNSHRRRRPPAVAERQGLGVGDCLEGRDDPRSIEGPEHGAVVGRRSPWGCHVDAWTASVVARQRSRELGSFRVSFSS